jgi:hypothetical protein
MVVYGKVISGELTQQIARRKFGQFVGFFSII